MKKQSKIQLACEVLSCSCSSAQRAAWLKTRSCRRGLLVPCTTGAEEEDEDEDDEANSAVLPIFVSAAARGNLGGISSRLLLTVTAEAAAAAALALPLGGDEGRDGVGE